MYSLWIFPLLLVTWRVYTSTGHISKVPKQIPWVGRTSGFFWYLTSQIRAIWKTPMTINEAYTRYSKTDAICAIPLPFSQPEILMPRSLIRWMISQAEASLSPTPLQFEITGAKYGFLDTSIEGDFAVYNVLRASLNKYLPRLVPIIMEELPKRIDENWGLDPNWREVPVHQLVRKVVGSVSARIILGAPLCFDEELLENMSKFTTCLVPSALLLRFFPPFLHPFLANLTTIFNRMYRRRCMKVLVPYVKQQLAVIEKEMEMGKNSVSREDILTWLIVDALRKKESKEGLVDRICCRIFVTVFASMETTTMTMSNALFDISSSAPGLQQWEGLCDEGSRMFSSCDGGNPDFAKVNGLIRADSALKETLRLRTSIKALATQVMTPDGIVLEGSKTKLPLGSRIAVSAWGIHHDEEFYPNASMYDAFRFSRPQEESSVSSIGGSKDNENRYGMVSASETYLPFGMGRHSCPGRYFAAVELKLFLAYLAVNYDMNLVGDRPKFVSVGHFPLPPMTAKLMVRRKGSDIKGHEGKLAV